MTTKYYVSREGDKFIRPVAIAVIVTQLFLMLAFLAVLASWAFDLNLYVVARFMSALTGTSVMIVAAQIWKLYFLTRRKLAGLRDTKIVWLASAVTAACVLSTVVVATTIPSMSADVSQETAAAVMAAQFITVLTTGLFAAKSTMAFTALFEAIRVTERARLN
ncbi:hypothetical protein [Lysobacter enzymogenes]|uniref:hypothetical protein n=1 Tax=Lysobacter enzymogenes TaxID=69 RepID=UPI001AF3C966|nr:hypothetical protein [Lysobacter enzymogenes]QQQ00953.1 hypothetical protein JHW41_23280 [Lysobacter enzymogenes]